jgi:hypothetical protein
MASSWRRSSTVCVPAFQACSTRRRGPIAGDVLQDEIHPGREHQPVIDELAAAAEAHHSARRIDGYGFAPEDIDAVFLQAVEAPRELRHRATAAEDQVRHRAGDELLHPIDEHDLELRVAGGEVLGARRAAEAGADDEDARRDFAAEGDASRQGGRPGSEKFTPLHLHPPASKEKAARGGLCGRGDSLRRPARVLPRRRA